MIDIAHLLRPAHLASLSNILKDPEASSNDKFVALELLKNANIASAMVLPGCQDTGTAIVQGKKGQNVWTAPLDAEAPVVSDEEALSKGVFNAYTQKNLRYSQVSPQDMFAEKNTGSNLPAQIELYASGSGNKQPYADEYNFLFMAKGGGSANKTFLFQQVCPRTPARTVQRQGCVMRSGWQKLSSPPQPMRHRVSDACRLDALSADQGSRGAPQGGFVSPSVRI